jgi:hypothetical protein
LHLHMISIAMNDGDDSEPADTSDCNGELDMGAALYEVFWISQPRTISFYMSCSLR